MSDSHGSCEISVDDGETLAVMRGEIDIASAPGILQAILASATASPRLVIDLSEVVFFDSSGVHLLDTVVRTAETKDVVVRVVAPEGCTARFVLRICAFREDLLVASRDAAR